MKEVKTQFIGVKSEIAKLKNFSHHYNNNKLQCTPAITTPDITDFPDIKTQSSQSQKFAL